jgi:hypothetical protein
MGLKIVFLTKSVGGYKKVKIGHNYGEIKEKPSPAFSKPFIHLRSFMNLPSEPFKKYSRWAFWIFAIFYIAFSLGTFRDYGITMDEHELYDQGAYLLKHWYHGNSPQEDARYIFSDEQASHNYTYTAFLHILSLRIPWKLHLLNLFFGLLAYWAAYWLLRESQQGPWWALLGPVFLFSILRFSGDVPNDPKDPPFAVVYLCALALIYRSREKFKSSQWEALCLGTVIGLATTVRVIGILLFPTLIFYRFYTAYQDAKREGRETNWRRIAGREWRQWGLIFLVSQFWVMALWPYVGSDYFGNGLKVFKVTSKYLHDSPTLFMGQWIPATQLPRDYLPVWLAIGIPLFILILAAALPFLLRRKWDSPSGRLAVLLGFSFCFQMAVYFVLHPNIYNAFRHYLFLAPILGVMAALALIEIGRGSRPSGLKRASFLLVGINFLLVMIELFRLYPYQYVYFNELAGGLKGGASRFESEYWIASFREASLWLEAHETTDPDKTYIVKLDTMVPWQADYFFNPNMKGATTVDHADYEISGGNPLPGPTQKVVYQVQREGVVFATVFKFERAGPAKRESSD